MGSGIPDGGVCVNVFQPRFSRSASRPASQAALGRAPSPADETPYPASLLALEAHFAPTDPVLAHIFTTMRSALGWSRERLAAGLQTSITTVDALEAGRVATLPPWSETLRIVEAYGRFVGIDVDAILDRLQSQSAILSPALPPRVTAAAPSMAHPVAATAAKPDLTPPIQAQPARVRTPRITPPPVPAAARPAVRTAPVSAPAANDPIAKIAARLNSASAAQVETARRSRRWRSRIAASIVAVVVGVGALLTALPASTNSEPVISLDRIAATFRDGLRWIDVADPRARKTDRLGAPQK